ncbi:Ig-like domain-containing protein [Pumilibacter intestinalis]|uniref:Ig-like domain-containing protein n=1 Tax=Pumilibacter intestinalis TaxID=2941511 RepID=UPI00203B6666|nr:Ig-like domain-containing protein [Pumilibacter intestinalis]
MTKKGYMPKLLAMLIGAIMCLCMATVAFTAAGVVGAKAEGETETDPNKLILEEVDEFNTLGYKIEKQSGVLDGTPYDYVMTVVDNTKGWWMVKKGQSSNLFFNNTDEIVWNITTQSGKNVNGGNFKYSKGLSLTSTDTTIGVFKTNNTSGYSGLYVEQGDKAEGDSTGRFKTGETVITAKFKTSSSLSSKCETHTKDPCTCHVDGAGNGEILTGKSLSVLYRVVHVDDNKFTFTGAMKDENNPKQGMWLKFNANEVCGVATADAEWTRAERFIDNQDSGGNTNFFFKDIFFLENFDLESATAAPTATELAGKSLYDLMSGENKKTDGFLFQTEVRPDHIEIFKGVRESAEDEEGKYVDFVAGDTFYLKEGLYLLGKDGNSNWATAYEGGADNYINRDQFFTFDGEKWSIDQFSTAISLDKKEAMIEVGANDTITANVEKGKFVSGEASTPVWSSDDEAVATVAGGVVTGVAAGTATIKAELADGTYATAEVTVVRNDEIKSITLDKRNITLYTGDENNTYTLVATIEGGSQASQAVTWTSANPAVATVDENGKVTAVAEGSTKVTATAADGKTAEVTVNVLQAEEENPPTPTPGPDDNTDNKGDETKDEGGCGSNVLGTSAIAASVLMLGAAVVLFARKKNAANK